MYNFEYLKPAFPFQLALFSIATYNIQNQYIVVNLPNLRVNLGENDSKQYHIF